MAHVDDADAALLAADQNRRNVAAGQRKNELNTLCAEHLRNPIAAVHCSPVECLVKNEPVRATPPRRMCLSVYHMQPRGKQRRTSRHGCSDKPFTTASTTLRG